eukprot:scaffold132753_cov47-Prasinocladus_malaysianus.AAC.2
MQDHCNQLLAFHQLRPSAIAAAVDGVEMFERGRVPVLVLCHHLVQIYQGLSRRVDRLAQAE